MKSYWIALFENFWQKYFLKNNQKLNICSERYKDVIDVSDKLMGITQHSTQVRKIQS